MKKVYYCYVLLNPLKPGNYSYDQFSFSYAPFYVGKGTANRANIHTWATKQGHDLNNPHKYRTILKILDKQLEPIIVYVLEKSSETDALNMEKYLISLIGRKKGILSRGILTNLTDGGEANPMSDPVVKEKMRKVHTGSKRTNQSKEKMRKAKKGKPLTSEHKNKIKITLKDNCRAGKEVCCKNVHTGEILRFPSVLKAATFLNISNRNIYSFIRTGNIKGNIKGWYFWYTPT